MTTILAAYGAYRLTSALRERIGQDFAAAGLQLDPPMQDVSRDARVRMTLTDAVETSDEGPEFGAGLGRSVTFWVPGNGGWIVSDSQPTSFDVKLVDVDLSVGDDHETLMRALPACLPGLTAAAVEDLFDPDDQAKFKWFPRREEAKRASMFIVTTDDDDSTSPDKAVVLSLGLVELAVGDRWLLTVRHPPSTYLSGSPSDVGQTSPPAARYVTSLAEYGLGTAKTAEEAAFAVISHGVDSFSRSRRVLASYLETWRSEFGDGGRDKSLLTDLQATLPLVVDALEPLRKPSVTQWLDGRRRAEAKEVSDQVERTYDALQDLQSTVSSAVSQADQAKNEEYQRSLATLAAVLLAPALIASIFGANIALEDSPLDLVWLLLSMVVAGGLTLLFIRRRFGPRVHTSAASTSTPAPHYPGASPSSPERPVQTVRHQEPAAASEKRLVG